MYLLYTNIDDQVGNEEHSSFTTKEVALFKTRFEEGYDILDDERYNEWLRKQGIIRVTLESYKFCCMHLWLSS